MKKWTQEERNLIGNAIISLTLPYIMQNNIKNQRVDLLYNFAYYMANKFDGKTEDDRYSEEISKLESYFEKDVTYDMRGEEND